MNDPTSEDRIRARFGVAPSAPAAPAPAPVVTPVPVPVPTPVASAPAPAAPAAAPVAAAAARPPVDESHPHVYNWLKACPYCGDENPDYKNKDFDAQCPWCGETIDKKEPHCHNCGVQAGTDGACKTCGRPVSMSGDECPGCHSKDAFSLKDHKKDAIDSLVGFLTKRKK